MLSEKADQATEAQETSFSAGDYFLGIAQRAISAGENIRVTLPGKGEVTLFPAKKAYKANITDQPGFFQAPAKEFQTATVQQDESPNTLGKNINELLWQAAFHASKGRLIEGCSKYDVVQFRNWPNLTQLPYANNSMRMFALLTRYPTTIMLVPRRLGAPKEEVYQTYSAAYCAGLVNMVSRNPQSTSNATEEVEEEPVEERGLFRSLFAKISGL